MRIKVLIAKSLLVTLPLTLIPTLAIAAPKVTSGSKCKVQKQKVIYLDKSFTCIKSGKRLVWSKGQVATKKTPTPTPTPIAPVVSDFEAWSLNIDSKSLSDQAQRNFLTWVKTRDGVEKNHSQLIQANPNAIRVSILQKADDLGAQLFSSYFAKGSKTIIGASEVWTNEQLALSGWETKCNVPSMTGVAYCLDTEFLQGYVITGDTTYNASNPGSDGGSLLAHEYFHLVQRNLSKTPNGSHIKGGGSDMTNAFPAWFVEGTADFVGFAVGALSQNATYWEGRARMFTYSPSDEWINKNSIADYEIRVCCGNDTPTYPYHIGRVATEYIVASIGFQKMLDIWIDYASTRNFETSFEKVAGISKETFYQKFDQIRIKVGLPAISWRLDGLVNKKIG